MRESEGKHKNKGVRKKTSRIGNRKKKELEGKCQERQKGHFWIDIRRETMEH